MIWYFIQILLGHQTCTLCLLELCPTFRVHYSLLCHKGTFWAIDSAQFFGGNCGIIMRGYWIFYGFILTMLPAHYMATSHILPTCGTTPNSLNMFVCYCGWMKNPRKESYLMEFEIYSLIFFSTKNYYH